MKRNMIEDFKLWGETEPTPFFLYGIKGVGKTYLVNDYANDFLSSFLYFKTEENSYYYEPFLLSETPLDFVAEHFGTTEDRLVSEVIIFDDTEKYSEAAKKLIAIAIKNKYKWIFISSYDYLSKDLKGLTKKQLFPVQFDEFIVALGEEWYVEAIKGHFESKKKLPDIVHTELLSDFEEYIWVGGMPEVVSDYLTRKSSINVTGLTCKNKKLSLETNAEDDSTDMKCRQILNCVNKQLYKENQKFMFNVIRTGVTYNMYSDALELLEKQGLILRQNEYSNDKKFKLFYPEFSFISSSRHDELTDVEYRLRVQNYILQTMKQKNIDCKFWESGNRADLDFVLSTIHTQFAADFGLSYRNDAKSIQSFNNNTHSDFSLKFSDSNYFSEVGRYTVPVYALFCLEADSLEKLI